MSAPYSRRLFLQQTALGAAGLSVLPLASRAAPGPASAPTTPPDIRTGQGTEFASRHPIPRTRPAGNFMDGAILGNGEMGVVVEPRPDMVMIHVGHNAVWDQRMQPIDLAHVGTFADTLQRILALPPTAKLPEEPWFKAILTAGKGAYQKTYPRPVTCGSVVLGLDRRETEILGYRVEIDRGVCVVALTVNGQPRSLEVFTEPDANRIWVQLLDDRGRPAPSPFKFVTILSDASIPKFFPRSTEKTDLAGGLIAYRQVLPFNELVEKTPYVPHDHDRAFCLSARLSGRLHQDKPMPAGGTVGAWIAAGAEPLPLVIALAQGFTSAVTLENQPALSADTAMLAAAARANSAMWRDYWGKSSVAIGDPLLERTWYWNMYFLRCALHARTVAPGMYAICPYPNRDTWWHGDYHMDYNTQQAFWSTFSSNHPELNLPYVGLVHHVLPEARKWAKDYYGMRGACFPVSSYPVELRGYPYGAPIFNWMMCISTWTVQGLWWHYVYTKDLDYLREKGFEPIKAVVQFMIDYINRPDVRQKDWGDDRAHIWPSFPPEIYGLMTGLPREYNADNLVEVTLLRFTLRAYLQACKDLGIEAAEATDMRDAQDILSRLPAYPTAQSPAGGKILVSVPAEDPERIYNVPINLMTVFPGEEHGLHSSPEEFELVANTLRSHQNEGGNEIVFLSLQAARLGLLDLEKFKRQIQYTLMPNGSCTDKNLQTGGRFGFSKTREYDWMASFGIWFENFALPVVINECMLQSYNGELRFFANWPKDKTGAFRSLRAAGAFLVSAEFRDGALQWAEIVSEKGGPLKIVSPWNRGLSWTKTGGSGQAAESRVEISTAPGDLVRLSPL